MPDSCPAQVRCGCGANASVTVGAHGRARGCSARPWGGGLRDGDLGRRLAGGPVGADRARGLQQQRQVLPVSTSTGVSAACVFTFIEADHPAVPVPERRGHRADPGGQLLVGERPAARTDSRRLAARSSPPEHDPRDDPGSARLVTRVPPPRAGAPPAAPSPARSASPGTGCRSVTASATIFGTATLAT